MIITRGNFIRTGVRYAPVGPDGYNNGNLVVMCAQNGIPNISHVRVDFDLTLTGLDGAFSFNGSYYFATGAGVGGYQHFCNGVVIPADGVDTANFFFPFAFSNIPVLQFGYTFYSNLGKWVVGNLDYLFNVKDNLMYAGLQDNGPPNASPTILAVGKWVSKIQGKTPHAVTINVVPIDSNDLPAQSPNGTLTGTVTLTPYCDNSTCPPIGKVINDCPPSGGSGSGGPGPCVGCPDGLPTSLSISGNLVQYDGSGTILQTVPFSTVATNSTIDPCIWDFTITDGGLLFGGAIDMGAVTPDTPCTWLVDSAYFCAGVISGNDPRGGYPDPDPAVCGYGWVAENVVVA